MEPRARSYDHQRQEKPEKGKYALLNASYCISEQIHDKFEVSVKDTNNKLSVMLTCRDAMLNCSVCMCIRARVRIRMRMNLWNMIYSILNTLIVCA